MTVFLVIMGIVILLIVVLYFSASSEQKTNEITLQAKGYYSFKSTVTGKYVVGHPELNEPVAKTVVYYTDDTLDIFDSTTLTQSKIAEIKKDSVTNILIEDKTTIERRVTVARLLLTGIFAFALKKKQVNELAYLIIEWSDEKFNHETIFEFEGKNSMEEANTARNSLIKVLR